MPHAEVGTTNLSDLRAISDWRNDLAWIAFQKRYDPLVCHCCVRLGLDSDAAEEVRQETWIAVANRIKSFAYEPKGSFRGWLWTVCHHEAMDFLERRRNDRTFPREERDECRRLSWDSVDLNDPTEEAPAGALAEEEKESTALAALYREAEEIQAAVRQRVASHTWEAFWLVGVVLWSVEETARYLQMSHTNVYKAKARVTRMLQAESGRSALVGIESGSADRPSG